MNVQKCDFIRTYQENNILTFLQILKIWIVQLGP